MATGKLEKFTRNTINDNSVLGLNLSGNEETITVIFDMQSVGGSIWNGSIYGIEASAATTIVLAFASALIFVIGRKRGKEK